MIRQLDTKSELRTMAEKIDLEASKNEDRVKLQDTWLKIQVIKFASLRARRASA